jgi:hypothetical protein
MALEWKRLPFLQGPSLTLAVEDTRHHLVETAVMQDHDIMEALP